VALVHAADGARIVSADLACPQCQAVFEVRSGIGDFRLTGSPSPTPDPVASPAAPDAMRLAALLGVGEPGRPSGPFPVLLAGHEAAAGAALADLGTRPQLWANPVPGAVPPSSDDLWAVLAISDRLPLGRGTLAAASLDAAHAGHATLVAAVALAIHPGGRLVAPADTPVPPEVALLARDEIQWVGEVRTAPGGLVTLRRQSPPA